MTYGPARARYERRKRHRQRQMANSGFWNVLTIVFAIGTIFLVVWFGRILFFQNLAGNQLTNQTTIQVSAQNNGIEVSQTSTLRKLDLTKTIQSVTPATEPSVEEVNFTFDQQAAPQNISISLFRPDRKCNWMGVAGQAFDLQGRPVPGVTAQVTGPLYGKEVRFLSLTGAAPWYGAGGYEVFLSEKPFNSTDLFQVRLVDQTGKGLSPRISFSTNSDCEKNLVIVNFHQIK